MNYKNDNLDEKALQRRELFGRYGLAMYHAQCVEKSLAILTSSVFHKEFIKSSFDAREKIVSKAFSNTLGRLIRILETQVKIPPNLNKNLIEALDKRNWLAHDYFYDRADDLLTASGKKKMISELTKLNDFLSDLDADLTSIIDTWSAKVGITKEIEKEKNKMIQKIRGN